MLEEGDKVRITNVKGIYGDHLFSKGDITEVVKLDKYPNCLALKSDKANDGGLILLPGEEKYVVKLKKEEF